MPRRPVVSDTSPLIKLAGVGLLELLPRLYGEIWILDAVRAEYGAKAGIGDPNLDTLPWLHVQLGSAAPSLRALPGLGAGEATAIALAQASEARLLVLDDKAARRIAAQRDVPIVGTLGVLLAAKQTGLLPRVRPVLTALVAQGRRISPRLREDVLRLAGEAER